MVAALALAAAGSSCGHDWDMADGGDADTLPEVVAEDGGSEDGPAEDGGSEDGPAEDGGSEDGPTETDAPDDDTSGPDDAAFDGPPPSCGNGVVDVGEECDPGGPLSVPGCDSDCTSAECGDGVLGILEGWTDGFESGMPADPPWENGEPYGFESTSLYAHGGTYALGSTNAGNRRSTAWIRLQAASGGEVCFWYMGEPGSGWGDEFRFVVDGVTAFAQGAAQLTWVQECVAVTPGVHVFEWRYVKGRSDAGTGLDAFYIDDIDTGGPFSEECDDGNTSSTDACVNGCRSATCGDGYVRAGAEDCDGSSASCTTTCGSTGSRTCTDCRAVGGCVPPAEVCNGADDDCDTAVDDGYDCVPGDSTGCANACGEPGTQTCGSACTWGGCCAASEVCQCGTLCDDDCDGLTDEDCIPC